MPGAEKNCPKTAAHDPAYSDRCRSRQGFSQLEKDDR